MKALTIKEFREKVLTQEVSVVEHTEKILEEAKKSNAKFNFFNSIAQEQALVNAKRIDSLIKKGEAGGVLLGVPFSVKDSICVKGLESTAGSKILKGYKPVFSATVIQRVQKEGAIVIGKNSMDEFGFGTFNVNVGVGFKVPLNPIDKKRSCGGSSGGGAGFTSFSNHTHACFGESTGGSIAAPASFCGVVGLTPTYSRLSRHGLIDYANSIDKIGSLTKTVEDAAIVLEASAGYDPKDSTSSKEKVEKYSSFVSQSIKGKTIGVVKEFVGKGVESRVQKIFLNKISELEKEGVKVKEISLPLNFKNSIPTYYLISTPEASTNLARFCGMRYGLEEDLSGHFDKYFSKVRSNGFGIEVKRRLMLGTFARMSGFRGKYYLRALKVRAKLLEEFKKVFKKVDLIAQPTMSFIAPSFKEIEKLSPLQHYYTDLPVNPANLAGLPHLTVNVGFDKKMPVGFMFTAKHFQEKEVIKAGSMLEVC